MNGYTPAYDGEDLSYRDFRQEMYDFLAEKIKDGITSGEWQGYIQNLQANNDKLGALIESEPSLQDISDFNEQLIKDKTNANGAMLKSKEHLDEIWEKVYSIDKTTGEELYALRGLLFEYRDYLRNISDMLNPDKVFGNLAMPASDFWDTGGFGKAQVAYMDKKFMYGAQKCGLTREEAVQRRAHLMGQGYSLEEAIALMWSVETEEDLEMFMALSDEPPDYETAFAIDPEALSGQMMVSVYIHSAIMQRVGDETGDYEPLEDFLNALVAGETTAYQEEYLLSMAAIATGTVEGEQAQLALALFGGPISEEAYNALIAELDSKMGLASLFYALLEINLAKESRDDKGRVIKEYFIDGLAKDGDKYIITIKGERERHDQEGTWAAGEFSTNYTVSFTNSTESTWQADWAAKMAEIQARKNDLIEETIIGVLGALCSAHPVAAGAYSALLMLSHLMEANREAGKNAADLLAALNGKLNAGEGKEAALQGGKAAIALLKVLCVLWVADGKMEGLSAEEQKLITEFNKNYGAWGLTLTPDDNSVIGLFSSAEQFQSLFAQMIIIEGGGISALIEIWGGGTEESAAEQARKLEAAQKALAKWKAGYDPNHIPDSGQSYAEQEKHRKAKQQVFDYLTKGVLPDSNEMDLVTWTEELNSALLELNQEAAYFSSETGGKVEGIFTEILQDGYEGMKE